MKTLIMKYDLRSLSYHTEDGWCLQRCFANRGAFWIQLTTLHLS
ncbi:hypothetical protein [Muriicola sp. Z0-33]|nr:hypothetical protein [Muriicola sp. Z0-33]